MIRSLLPTIVICCSLPVVFGAEEEVFSGPQIDERLASFQTLGLYEEQEGKPIDLIAEAEDGPVMIFFVHEKTRPGFGLMRAITKFAAERKEPNMKVGVVFLSDDVTETTKWATNVRRFFSDNVTCTVSPDGKEGPGAYGLNRNVTLTILVGNEGKVTGNFAIVQPQLQADGPGILKSIVEVTGGGDVPSIEQLDARYAREMNMRRETKGRAMPQGRGRAAGDPDLSALLRAVINKRATEDQVRKAAARVEGYVEKNERARQELARIVTTVVNSGKIENYGTATAQGILRKWLAEFGEAERNDDSKSEESEPSNVRDDEG